jgi:hypothetical protein
MKKRFVAYAFLIAAVVSVTSGCVVREGGYGYHHRYHHDRYYNGY